MNQTVPAAFAASVAQHAERIAFLGEDGTQLSYAELDRQRFQAARALLSLGVKAGDRVAIWAPNCLHWIVAGLAAHSVGAAIVPVNTRMRGEEAGYVLKASGARVLFCIGQMLGSDYPNLLKPHRPSSLQHLVVIEPRNISDATDISWQQFLDRAEGSTAEAVAARAAAVKPNDCMDILFTSGTTGLPKGVVTTHHQNLRAISDWANAVAITADDRYLVVNPFFHAFGYKYGWLCGLLRGCTILPHAIFDAGAILKRIERDRITVLPGPPTLFISLLNDPARATTDLSSLRATITGAAAIAPSLIERIRAELGFNVVLTGYGLTETCGVVTLCDAADDAETIALTSGKAIPNIEVRCVDSDNQPVAAGVAGEIVVRGYNVMQGYLDNPAATAEAIDPEGWFHTGDIGVLDTRGYLKITDRLKDMYITGGFNCYPAEIERLMAAHPAIAQVAIVGVPDERMGEVGKAYVVLRPDSSVSADALIKWCREKMANYKVPRQVEFMTALPLNPSGKVLKFQLRAQQR